LRVLSTTLGLPLVSVAIVVSLIHYIQDERFNQGLLFDLVARPRHDAVIPEPAPALELEAVV
jgi:hypothetical protein